MSTFETDAVTRELIRKHIDDALTEANKLPDFEGRALVLRLNQARELAAQRQPMRVISMGFRRRRLWPPEDEGDAA